MDKIEVAFLDAINKQIEAQTNTYKLHMNRYERSISILYSALNMIHESCPEYSEALVEIAKCRRLLAVNKKHLRGQWRQDAIMVDEINLNQLQVKEGQDRKEQLEEKDLEGEVSDLFIDYKEEAIKSFIELMHEQNESSTNEEEGGTQTKVYKSILDNIGDSSIENILGTFALEYAECRGNLNPQ